ncbi:MAG: hypothetical protein KBD96_00195 [Brachymonas sp.]|nr:hypothetical protein [Brachymonas sp.]MBP6138667.1 hypothetical protein [Brachymonas sp.]MBP6966412.1 hypothetical protein [Brachymonas sp.]MBP7739862.1 hypothetical protein [Brachymonas sp.]MBP8596220.1 hypothetical protein [Brachymonas sp.]
MKAALGSRFFGAAFFSVAAAGFFAVAILNSFLMKSLKLAAVCFQNQMDCQPCAILIENKSADKQIVKKNSEY